MRRASPLSYLVTAAALAASLAACQDESTPLLIADDRPDAGCIRNQEPSTYEVFFVIDVSGSMGPFLTELKEELVSFANGFPERDALGRRVRIDYYVVAFVNDVKVYGDRMTTIIALQAAFDEAIAAGQTNYNLTVHTFNSEPEENLLDAMSTALQLAQGAEAKLIMMATDAPFFEAPQVLSERIPVQTAYGALLADLQTSGARIHAFTASALDGITREFKHQPPLTSLPGSTVHRLQDLQGANDLIRETLAFIARESSCN